MMEFEFKVVEDIGGAQAGRKGLQLLAKDGAEVRNTTSYWPDDIEHQCIVLNAMMFSLMSHLR